MTLRSATIAATAATIFSAQLAQAADSCSNTLAVSYPAPKAADGWTYRLVADGFTKPRGLVFDKDGALLVVDSGSGLLHLTFKDDGGDCVSLDKQTTLIDNDKLNHGIALTGDGKTLYASSSEMVYYWDYNSKDISVGDPTTLITNMSNSDHTTRTLHLSQKNSGLLLVSRGSDSNEDSDALEKESGHAQIRSFDLSKADSDKPYHYTDGDVLGWGLRNSVGVAEHPEDGGIWSVENSVDELDRDGKDIHQDNPAEELNFHGYLNGSTEHQGGNYGYPNCYAIWSTDKFPELGSLKTGDQFPGPDAKSITDESCNSDYVPPRLAFQAHMAPLDIKFNTDGSEAYVTFHGSWDRDNPVGHRISSVSFANGSPTASQDSMDAAQDILTTPDLSKCPNNCVRPVGLAWDSQGRLWFSSDSTGEIFVMSKANSTSDGGSGGDSGDDSDQGGDGGSAGNQLLPGRIAMWATTIAALSVAVFLI